jgi:hypothetical protein
VNYFHRIQADNFHEFNGISAFILPQFENISATYACVVATFCMSVSAMTNVSSGNCDGTWAPSAQ